MMSVSWFELTRVVCGVSCLCSGSGNSGLTAATDGPQKQTVLMTGGPDDVSEQLDLVQAHRGVSVQSSI